MHAAEFPLLSVGQFGLLAAQFPPGAGDGHALAGAHADEIGFELGEGGEDIEEHLAHGIARVVERPAEGQFDAAFPKLVGDGARIGGTDLASRSSFGTTSVSPARTAARAWSRPWGGRARVVPVRP